ncbi:MAG TPA: hypothetical protein PKM44_11900 [Turneriella sp.]|nr:hypothetical protein [Turneriella sp.]HNJ65354.1 hypothetical protein [Turneriella sp.]HNL11209.1 hypothetical protein [Turneriella sp.]HNL55470.1 hypothetical protein [Turneriella sp.]HNN01329.1 hypothetical protein [Turneriella sp.]
MKVKIITSSVLLAAAMAACHKEPAGAGGHDHHGEATASVGKPVKKFATDDNLRVRMTAILNTMKAMHDAGAKVNLAKTAAKIEATVQDIFKKCKLEPAADAAIHPILAELLKGAELFKKGNEKEGHDTIHKALLRYEDFFDHPGWDHSK